MTREQAKQLAKEMRAADRGWKFTVEYDEATGEYGVIAENKTTGEIRGRWTY